MRAGPGMDRPERWLAALRILVGLWFLKSLFTKIHWSLAGGFLPVPGATERWLGFLPGRLAEYAAGNPLPWYRAFLEHVAVPHAQLFAQLTALGEAAVGVGLVLGLFTEAAAGVGFLLALNYGLASYWQGPGQQGFHLVLAGAMLAFLGARAGRVWGLDAWLVRLPARRPAAPPASAAPEPLAPRVAE